MSRDLSSTSQVRPATSLVRAAFACAMASGRGVSAPQLLAERHPGDPVSRGVMNLLTRTAKDPASTTGSAWADTLAVSAVGDFIGSLAPMSAGAQLIAAGLKASLDGVDTVKLPGRDGLPTAAGLVAEGAPIPVKQYVTTAAELGPSQKVACACAMTSELSRQTRAEEVVTALLKEDAAAGLDAAMFSADAPGLLADLSSLDASAETAPIDALLADLGTLGDAVAIATLDEALAFVTSPASTLRARRLLARAGDLTPVWSSPAVADDTLIAVSPRSFVSAVDPVPTVEVGREAVLHMNNQPLAVVAGGVVSTPLRSLWQTDSVALRVVLNVAWTMRQAGAVQFISGIAWGAPTA